MVLLFHSVHQSMYLIWLKAWGDGFCWCKPESICWWASMHVKHCFFASQLGHQVVTPISMCHGGDINFQKSHPSNYIWAIFKVIYVAQKAQNERLDGRTLPSPCSSFHRFRKVMAAHNEHQSLGTNLSKHLETQRHHLKHVYVPHLFFTTISCGEIPVWK